MTTSCDFSGAELSFSGTSIGLLISAMGVVSARFSVAGRLPPDHPPEEDGIVGASEEVTDTVPVQSIVRESKPEVIVTDASFDHAVR